MQDAHVPAEPWPAPAAPGPLRARLVIPGSKSITNRALVLAALADGPGLIVGPLQARDTALMRRALTALGATISGDGTGSDGGSGPGASTIGRDEGTNGSAPLPVPS